jgi:SAM-dependent methyltransferase
LAIWEIIEGFRNTDKNHISFLDLGAGTGFWTDLVATAFTSQGLQADVVALDVSKDALDVIAERLPHVRRIQEDLATIPPDKFSHAFDLVTACYCLHHIVRTNDFLNALRFAGTSVNVGGFLLIMDPVLTRAYSQFDVIDRDSFRGNGIPRHLYMIDDILADLNFKRCSVRPAISYLLNGCIEASNLLGYSAMSGLWKVLCAFYKSEQFVRFAGGLLTNADAILKRRNMAFSSSICLYQKAAGTAP